ncbi:unnamed protein product [Paramecium sonneborni]|uniref:MORN repeat-containing protein n=1 Tax=Paramecium sonneborni TaxID=65129 RepID=A0A8S1R489_9CILI|nr:unnamed protein product [Paramecium sonneborni]
MKEHKDGIYQGGQNKKEQKHGVGVYLWDVGCAYYGEWKEDLIDGQGILFLGGQIIIQGGFKKGVAHGYVVIKVGRRVFYSQFDKGEALFIQEGERKITIQQSSAQITCDCGDETDRILQGISKLQQGDLQIQLFNHCIYYGNVGKANLPNGLGIEISNLFYQCGQFVDGKLNGLGRLEQQDEIYQGSFQQGQYHGNGLMIIQNQQIQWVKGRYNQGQLIEIKSSGYLDQMETPQELVFTYSKKTNQQYLITPISKDIILGYIRLFEVMQFVRLRVNTLTEIQSQQYPSLRKYSTNTNTNTLSKSVEEIRKLQSQFNTRNLNQQNQIYEFILDQHDENQTQRKTDTQQSRTKTQPTDDYYENKISFGLLEIPSLKNSRKTAAFQNEEQQYQIKKNNDYNNSKRSSTQNEVKQVQQQQQQTNDRMLTLKNILEAQKQKYSSDSKQKKTVFADIQQNSSTAQKTKQIIQQNNNNLQCLSEVVQKELNRSPPSEERRSTIKPIYNQSEENEQNQFSSHKPQPSKFNVDYTAAYNDHKTKIHSLLNKFNSIKIKPTIKLVSQNFGLSTKSLNSKQSIQKVYDTNEVVPLNNIQNCISLISHKNTINERNLQTSLEKHQSKKMDDSYYHSQCNGNCTQIQSEDQNTKYIQEIRQELAEQKQMLTQLFQSIQQKQTQVNKNQFIKRLLNTPQRNIQLQQQQQPKQVYVYPTFTLVKSVSPVRI